MHSKLGQCWKYSVNVTNMSAMLLADFIQAMNIKEAEANKEPMQAFILTKDNHLETLKMTKFFPNTSKLFQKSEYPI